MTLKSYNKYYTDHISITSKACEMISYLNIRASNSKSIKEAQSILLIQYNINMKYQKLVNLSWGLVEAIITTDGGYTYVLDSSERQKLINAYDEAYASLNKLINNEI